MDARHTIAEEHLPIDASEDVGVNPSLAPSIGQLIDRRLTLKGLVAAGALGALGSVPFGRPALAQAAGPSSLRFKEIPHTLDPTDHVPEGYEKQVVVRWGDKLSPDAPAFDPAKLTAPGQAQQFGYNCDFVGYLPLPRGSTNSEHGLLAVNHEYTSSNLMFAGLGSGRGANRRTSKEQAEVEIAAHGVSIFEVKQVKGRWQVVENSRYNRRITAATPIAVSGPAAGHAKLKTAADPTGAKVLGTLNNCAGGVTPWGTLLTAEENFNGYFGGDAAKLPDAEAYKRYGISKDTWYSWASHFDRFNVEKEANEPNRFGWVVEIDPYEPASTPVKHTALGRFKHEGAHGIVNKDGRLVIYQGDDERFDYVYKYVSAAKYDAANRAANSRLLDEGTLFVAQFADDGKVTWLPLLHGQGPLTAENGFAGQADVLINARKAADLLQATPMDRPEDVEPNPVTGRVYLILTNNTSRKAEQVNKANPRAGNAHGHVVEIIPPGSSAADMDHAATEAKWEIFLLAGKPGMDTGTRYHRATSEHGWLSCPDNCAFDAKGRIWIATDGARRAAGVADGLYAADTLGNGRALTRLFYQAPTGAEVCGPCFTPDGKTVFLAIQHPGEDAGSTFETPSTRWPDFKADMPPRPSVIAVVKRGGGEIGG